MKCIVPLERDRHKYMYFCRNRISGKELWIDEYPDINSWDILRLKLKE